jgi:Protein of unknown function (DUF2567)
MSEPVDPPEDGPGRGHTVSWATPGSFTGADPRPSLAHQPSGHSLRYPVSPVQPMPRRLPQPSQQAVRWAVAVLLGLVLAGLLGGLMWAQLAPRLPFRVVQPGQVVATKAESEVFIAADGWFVVVTVPLGVLAGALAWLPRAARGPLMPFTLAVGGTAGAVATRLIGQLLARGPDDATLRRVGTVVLAPVRLRATAFAVAEAFVALLVYLLLVGFAEEDDLGQPAAAWRHRRPYDAPSTR